jgi:hypothetical protein
MYIVAAPMSRNTKSLQMHDGAAETRLGGVDGGAPICC